MGRARQRKTHQIKYWLSGKLGFASPYSTYALHEGKSPAYFIKLNPSGCNTDCCKVAEQISTVAAINSIDN